MQYDTNKIEELASLFFTVDEIAILLDIDIQDLRRQIKSNKTDESKAYYRGKLQTQIELRKKTLEFAQKGSPQAETAMLEFLKKQNQSENA